MIKEGLPFFYFKGISSLNLSLIIKSRQIYEAPARDKTFRSIPGRRGDLIIDNERYPNVVIKYTVTIVRRGNKTFEDIADEIKDWLLVDPGYDILWDSFDTRYYRLASPTSGVSVAKSSKDVGELQITFSCMPMRYSFDGQKAIELLSTGGTLYNPFRYSSLPYIKIYGNGDISVHVGSQTVEIEDVDDYVEIDSEMMVTHKGLVTMSSSMSGNYPVLLPGDNLVSFTGSVTGAEIIPRWCRL